MAKKKEHPIREPKEKASNGTRKPEEKEHPIREPKEKASNGTRKAEEQEHPIKEPKEKASNGTQQLFNLLKKEPELMIKLAEALNTGRFFITITFQKKYRPDDEHDLHHYWTRKNIMVNDVVPALRHVAADFTARENPTAELPDKKNWH